MRDEALHPNDHTFVTLLKACGKLKDLQTAHHLHAQILKKGILTRNAYVGTALVDMHAKCGSFLKAQEAFDSLPVQEAVSWNALIAGYTHGERGIDALNCFHQMKIQGISPSAITYACILKACASYGEAEQGKVIHNEILGKGLLDSNQYIGNALVDMYAKCGLLSKAHQIFIELPDRDLVAWNALISGYVGLDYAEDAFKCLNQMRLDGISPNAVTFVCILNACSIITDFEKGIKIHSEIEQKELLKMSQNLGNALVNMYAKYGRMEEAQNVFDRLLIYDLSSWNSLVSGYARSGCEEKALSCLNDIQIQGFFPDAVTMVSILKACGNIGALERGKKIHLHAKEKGLLRTNQLVGNALVDMYTKCGMLESANQIFETLPDPTIVTWTTLITGYAQLGQIENALWVLDSMIGEGIEPNAVTFVSVLNACSHAGFVEMGQQIFEVMMNCHSIKPTFEHHTCMIDLFGRAGQLDNAVRFTMDKPFHPNIAMWLDMLGACRKSGNVEFGEKAFMHALLFDENESAAYVCLSNMYAEAG